MAILNFMIWFFIKVRVLRVENKNQNDLKVIWNFASNETVMQGKNIFFSDEKIAEVTKQLSKRGLEYTALYTGKTSAKVGLYLGYDGSISMYMY